jgi:hypothetical protein
MLTTVMCATNGVGPIHPAKTILISHIHHSKQSCSAEGRPILDTSIQSSNITFDGYNHSRFIFKSVSCSQGSDCSPLEANNDAPALPPEAKSIAR